MELGRNHPLSPPSLLSAKANLKEVGPASIAGSISIKAIRIVSFYYYAMRNQLVFADQSTLHIIFNHSNGAEQAGPQPQVHPLR